MGLGSAIQACCASCVLFLSSRYSPATLISLCNNHLDHDHSCLRNATVVRVSADHFKHCFKLTRRSQSSTDCASNTDVMCLKTD